jgi:hypothetical protein
MNAYFLTRAASTLCVERRTCAPVSGIQLLSTAQKSTDGTPSHWKYIIGDVIAYCDLERGLSDREGRPQNLPTSAAMICPWHRPASGLRVSGESAFDPMALFETSSGSIAWTSWHPSFKRRYREPGNARFFLGFGPASYTLTACSCQLSAVSAAKSSYRRGVCPRRCVKVSTSPASATKPRSRYP